ncbi:hypothetical protein ISN45_Aa07g033290 [Arabidopsis thaliana x Arabidopsis arenosa]|uniref:Uncharacterized protein n=1 Tax=Arabidopsis thaliana x Arabidopsis arenosa TaxID=1240361 RepID=A0A8T1YAB9_9BRAS|nr:hypothetical protein ISN45_Aa07g033290 [Arabidopsis thaliana x Arabidopsis arenosa]
MASPQGEPSDSNPPRFPSGESLFPTGDGFTPQGVAIPCFLSSMSREEKIECHEFMEKITERYVFLCSERQRLGRKRRLLEERIARTERKIRRLESDVHNWERRGFDSIARIPGCLREHIRFLKKYWDIYQRSLEPDERENAFYLLQLITRHDELEDEKKEIRKKRRELGKRCLDIARELHRLEAHPSDWIELRLQEYGNMPGFIMSIVDLAGQGAELFRNSRPF